MNMTLSIDLEQNRVEVRFVGKLDVKDIINSLKSMMEHPDYRKGMNMLFDFTDAYIDADYYELDRLRNYISAVYDFLGECRCACIAQNNPSKVVIKLLSIMCEAYHLGFHSHIFEEHDMGLKWLEAEHAEPLHEV